MPILIRPGAHVEVLLLLLNTKILNFQVSRAQEEHSFKRKVSGAEQALPCRRPEKGRGYSQPQPTPNPNLFELIIFERSRTSRTSSGPRKYGFVVKTGVLDHAATAFFSSFDGSVEVSSENVLLRLYTGRSDGTFSLNSTRKKTR